MRTLKYAILGLLCREPLTGYDIARVFEKGLGNFWSAGHSQIYPELKKLLDEGLVEFSTMIQGERLEKKLYVITVAGKADFQRWIERDEPLEPTSKDAFKLRIFLSDMLDDEQLLSHLSSQIEKRKLRLAVLEGALNERYRVELPHSLDKRQRGDYVVLYGAIMREKTYIEWLEWCTEYVK